MSKLITASINLSKIDKSKIQTVDKNGQPFKDGAKYINININLNDQKDNYGNDCSIAMSQTKEQRDAKEPRVYLGNGKVTWSSDATTTQPTTTTMQANTNFEKESDLPF